MGGASPSASPRAGTLAHLGVLRATGRLAKPGETLPTAAVRQGTLFMGSPAHLRTWYAELTLRDVSMAQTRATRALGDRPLVVVSAEAWPGSSDAVLARVHGLHRELAERGARGASTRAGGTRRVDFGQCRVTARSQCKHAWALGKIGSPETVAALRARESVESDAWVLAELGSAVTSQDG